MEKRYLRDNPSLASGSCSGFQTQPSSTRHCGVEVRRQGGGEIDVNHLLIQATKSQLIQEGWVGGSVEAQWRALAWLAVEDVAAARVLEPHWDAQNILAQSEASMSVDVSARSWGVFAAAGGQLSATRIGANSLLSGNKPWCSLASVLDWALITVPTDDGTQLFALDLKQNGVNFSDQEWKASGLREITSTGISLLGALAQPIGPVGWYLNRPGFAWGGIGVAAAWYGGMVGILRAGRAAATKREPDQLALAALGEGRRLELAALSQLKQAAAMIESSELDDREIAWSLALAIRGNIAQWAHRSIEITKQLVGPAGLSFNAELTKRIQDLDLYLAQGKGQRDDASLGHRILSEKGTSNG